VVGMNAQVVPLPASTSALDASNDPGAFVVAALTSAKGWLEQAQVVDLPDVAEAKARAEAVACYVTQKHLGREAELAAAEIVRRAQRRIGELVREGQANGEVRRRGQREGHPASVGSEATNSSAKRSPQDLFINPQDRADTYAMTDGVTAEDFEQAIHEANSEGNLSRSNVARKAQQATARRISAERPRETRETRAQQIRELSGEGNTSEQIAARLDVRPDHIRRIAADEGITVHADEVIGRARRIDPNRIVRETASTLDALVSAVELVDVERLDQEELDEWATSMRRSLRALQRFTKELNR
jgi:hypothetical protein